MPFYGIRYTFSPLMQKEKIRVLLSFTVLAFAAYSNCFDVFIPGDNYSIFYLFDEKGITGSIKNLGPYFVTLPLIFCLYKFIGLAPYAWVGISVILHIINAYLAYRFTKAIIISFVKKPIPLLPFFSGLVFLISPYQTEAILWTPTDIFILISTGLCLGCSLMLLTYFEFSGKLSLRGFHILFLLAMFSYETSCIIPGISVFIYTLYYFNGKSSLQPVNFMLKILLPQIGIILSYLIVTKLLFGSWLWHSGSFEISFSVFSLIKTGLKYLVKFFLFYRYIPLGEQKAFTKYIISNYYLGSLLFLVIISTFIYFFRRLLRTDKEMAYIIFALFACFIVSLLPVLILDSSFLSYIYPDRYGYLPSAFFYIFFVLVLFHLLKKFAIPFLIFYCVLCWFLLFQTTAVWRSVSSYCEQITQNYKPFLKKYDRVYILNVPTYYKGVAAYRSAFAETIYMKLDKSSINNIRVISGCYQESGSDTLISVSKKGNTINVLGPQKENPYFSTGGGWARSFKTDEYSVEYDPTGCSYVLLFKHEIPKNSIFIYLSNSIWKKVE